MFYTKEVFPEYIKFVKDTDENRELIGNKLGELKFIIPNNYSYIQINIQEKSWRTSLDFEWLYRNEPPLLSIGELLQLIK